jgi:trigger factor
MWYNVKSYGGIKIMKFEKLGTNYAKFTFTIEPELFNKGLDHAFDKVKGDVEVKGFRKGHVPREIYESRFGVESLYEEALNYVISANYEKVFAEESVIIVGEPKVDVDISKVSREKTFEVSLTFPIKPEVVLGEYINAKVAKRNLVVSDEEIDAEINRLLAQNNSLVPKEGDTLENGDVSVIDFEGFLDGVPFEGGKAENHELEIGSGMFIPGFEEQMVGMKVGEEKDINVTFPEEYHAEDLKGKEVVFKVKLHEIKVEEKAELNDAFVENLNKEGIKTVAALKEDIENRLRNNKEKSEKNRIIGTAVKFAVDNAKVDIPIEMINYEAENMIKYTEDTVKNQYGIEFEMYLQLMGMTLEQYKKEMHNQAQDKVLTSLVIEAIAAKENFTVTDEEVDAKYEEIANSYNMEKADVEKQLSKDIVIREVQFGKAVDYLEANVLEVEEEPEKTK